MNNPLLPPNASPLARNLAKANQFDLSASAIQLSQLWQAEHCPETHLPWLAWSLSVDSWDDTWAIETKRQFIAQSITWHRKKGTPWAIKQALAQLGYPVLELIEYQGYQEQWQQAGGLNLNGEWAIDGQKSLALKITSTPFKKLNLAAWFDYALKIDMSASPWGREQQRLVRQIANDYAPARCRLRALIISAQILIEAPIRFIKTVQKSFTRYRGCQIIPVHRWSTLNGCWTLSNQTTPYLLDGLFDLSAKFGLTGKRLSGPALDSAFSTIRHRSKTLLKGLGTGGALPEFIQPLSPMTRLNGQHFLSGRQLSGHRSIDASWSLNYPTLNTFGLRHCDGSWCLGQRFNLQANSGIHCSAIVRRRSGGVTLSKPCL